MTTFTSTIRLTEPTVGGDTGLWGGEINNDLVYIDEAVNQSVTINIADTDITLTADGSSGDQARYLRYRFSGALTADRTVTLPSNQKVGYASNDTTGGHSLTLTTGAGTTLTLSTDEWTLFQCDGTNVSAVPLSFGGTTTNDNAEAGRVGEYLSNSRSSGAPIAMTNNVAVNVVQLTLTAGDWDVSGNVVFNISSSCNNVQSWIGLTSVTRPSPPNNGAFCELAGPSFVSGTTLPTGTARLSLSSTTTVYLGAIVLFSAGTVSSFGFIGARRAR
jgi:hypothetical protein